MNDYLSIVNLGPQTFSISHRILEATLVNGSATVHRSLEMSEILLSYKGVQSVSKAYQVGSTNFEQNGSEPVVSIVHSCSSAINIEYVF